MKKNKEKGVIWKTLLIPAKPRHNDDFGTDDRSGHRRLPCHDQGDLNGGSGVADDYIAYQRQTRGDPGGGALEGRAPDAAVANILQRRGAHVPLGHASLCRIHGFPHRDTVWGRFDVHGGRPLHQRKEVRLLPETPRICTGR